MIVFRGMYGVGDCLHQRAILRDVVQQMGYREEIVLETFYKAMHHDVEGVRLKLLGGIEPRVRERDALKSDIILPRQHTRQRITYDPIRIKLHGSILAAQYASVGLPMPEKPDFSLAVPQQWRDWAREKIGDPQGKPVLVYRPIVLNNVWRAESRSPDPALYSALFRTIRDQYHVVSVANIGNHGETIVGETQDADVNYNRGELDFETMSGLFAEADLAFTNPGFAPVLSQAVGTRTVIVYGGNESYRTTNCVGSHLASTLAIEPDVPCACHDKKHDCNKHITLPPAIARLEEFICAS